MTDIKASVDPPFHLKITKDKEESRGYKEYWRKNELITRYKIL